MCNKIISFVKPPKLFNCSLNKRENTYIMKCYKKQL